MFKKTFGDRNFSGTPAIDTEDGEEMNIYANADEINSHDVCRATEDTRRNQTFQHTGSECVRNRRLRSVLVCLVVLCVLLLTAVIVLCVLIYTNNHQFHINYKNITQDRDQLLTKYTKLTEERNELLTNNIKLTEEKDQLLNKYTIIDGCIYYQSGLYFISSEKKSWTESRRYCRERGADLIIINNKEEQDLILKVTDGKVAWIGLSDSDEEGRWKWVDGSTLTSGFWASNEPNGQTKENCVESHPSGWNDNSCNKALKCIFWVRVGKYNAGRDVDPVAKNILTHLS
ncbi:C-type lectin domain family 17, member A-like [Triplophysa rosa]|uniref:C-type lectin domain family 17, member A-like n=1 Tax=Triplophysa rosa TaxID=992332 RepID=UPI0025461451|nr:C-type lectin domain family 17, member A-like [Triplophysa rosa]